MLVHKQSLNQILSGLAPYTNYNYMSLVNRSGCIQKLGNLVTLTSTNVAILHGTTQSNKFVRDFKVSITAYLTAQLYAWI